MEAIPIRLATSSKFLLFCQLLPPPPCNTPSWRTELAIKKTALSGCSTLQRPTRWFPRREAPRGTSSALAPLHARRVLPRRKSPSLLKVEVIPRLPRATKAPRPTASRLERLGRWRGRWPYDGHRRLVGSEQSQARSGGESKFSSTAQLYIYIYIPNPNTC